MEVAKVFTNGGSQAVRLPKDCRFEGNEVVASRIGEVVVLLPKSDSWAGAKQGIKMFSGDFLAGGIEDLPLQERPAHEVHA